MSTTRVLVYLLPRISFSMTKDLEIRRVSPAEVLPLRAAVLRNNGPLEIARFPNDEAPTTLHLGAFVPDASAGDELVGVVSLFPQSLPATLAPNISHTDAWQLRGMAIVAHAQGRGYGRVLLQACIHEVKAHGGTLLWCNARASAVGFYLTAGFETHGEEFELPGIGPHYVMMLRHL